MDVIFMSFENFCFALFLAVMIIPLIAVRIAEFFIWLKEKVKRMERCCGTCKYHEHENISDGYVCCNSDSEYVADWTDYEDCCEEWEERE